MKVKTMLLKMESDQPIKEDTLKLRGFFARKFNGYLLLHNHLGNNKFSRLRIGIWGLDFSEKSKEITQSYVLEKFLPEEQEKLIIIKKEAIEIIASSV